MDGSHEVRKLEGLIADNPKFIFTIISYALILILYVNLNTFRSPFLGLLTSVLYFLINGIFLGQTFFRKESTFFRLALGMLVFTILLGFVGWLAVIIYNLNFIQFALVLLVSTTLSSLLNRKVKNENAPQDTELRASTP